ncbi:four helix bundle protein [Candidatus Falkowbacteria bacterium]|jgi:four helix bundle protein|nr:four helix bundle protein [Candidatus Falkowbacteria bacterium]MBT6573717.1 four helix bundle protein [Candidatus Falkowbacteria bacterium]MBT7349093.1 four helix bundle protein [Candidatus Falkowbacteria bacterium]MBT7500044.1 four helix bundle protein [Candidatus Falkowbacteria bacterium]
MESKYIPIEDVFVYKISLELCDLGWQLYEFLSWQDRKILGDQFIRSVDSNAANIVEGYGRFHYLDRIKFYYNARASLMESKHWCDLMYKREKITQEKYKLFVERAQQVHYQLNKWIKTTYSSRDS